MSLPTSMSLPSSLPNLVIFDTQFTGSSQSVTGVSQTSWLNADIHILRVRTYLRRVVGHFHGINTQIFIVLHPMTSNAK